MSEMAGSGVMGDRRKSSHLAAVQAVADVSRGDGAGGQRRVETKHSDAAAVPAQCLRGVPLARHLSRCTP